MYVCMSLCMYNYVYLLSVNGKFSFQVWACGM